MLEGRTLYSRSTKTNRIASLGALLSAAILLVPNDASAQESQRWSGGGGVFLGANFKSGRDVRFTWGLEAFGMRRFNEPLDWGYDYEEPAGGMGPQVQVTQVSGDSWRFSFGALGGVSPINASHSMLAELGATWHLGQKKWGLRTGFVYEPLFANVAARHDFFIGESSLTGGLRFPGSFGAGLPAFWSPMPGALDGRPLRTDSSPAARSKSETMAERWGQMAQDEFEAVFAFVNLAVELIEVDAPETLVRRAEASANQELEHAKFCLREARRYDPNFELSLPDEIFRTPLTRSEALARLATEGLTDGVFGEGLAASRIAAGLPSVRCDDVAAGLRKIVEEEKGHAALGESIARWALTCDTDGMVREHLFRVGKAQFMAPSEQFAEKQHGFISSSETALLAEKAHEQTQQTLRRLLT